ncbi:MAG: sugar dehydrogenase, partial [Verrucomicrobia bacterium]|nr:sugar dehydrogenase [Verrucomicrobiota bacterium]NDB78029.1 sugar dehydrogenase [Verrucomicrobiota bacterium]NDD38301.1 sugar dehydrogenase [Verrucomicrobiota bacterium]NDE98597.1 sugar dehydrogenase [Verrucomicrobiota bacterium]
QPEDIADGILALISADLVTGQTLVVDGGHTIGPRVTHGIK